jgi:ribonuclease HII
MLPEERDEAFAEITAKACFAVGVCDHTVIDAINILQASLLAMSEAVHKLKDRPDCLLIDGPITPVLDIERHGIVDGDAKSFSIACASVVAKVTRDRIMRYYDTLYPQYGFARHKGYSTDEHWKALNKYGPTPIHRRSFEPIRNLIRERAA